ncbi:alpha 1,4-glycosyltransferase conserved region-domain-containing protein [Polychytrium aggregatum]|uniref:alpha 1,4-glycosyltransferase conserved region-domain-containing protein n=1 Tax=Polychytrium aggregatum TaxID=110093 RepID=UPI0022FDE7CD|nr:alpha 1,4-glycosyltransferase conserved region-domain-containing protein [Polychytrium aggregatum]KAI9206159.1 alpha 1,4-glycosyltransferase conserved region-domain-containing protein [Polychytrium aggregatum]
MLLPVSPLLAVRRRIALAKQLIRWKTIIRLALFGTAILVLVHLVGTQRSQSNLLSDDDRRLKSHSPGAIDINTLVGQNAVEQNAAAPVHQDHDHGVVSEPKAGTGSSPASSASSTSSASSPVRPEYRVLQDEAKDLYNALEDIKTLTAHYQQGCRKFLATRFEQKPILFNGEHEGLPSTLDHTFTTNESDDRFMITEFQPLPIPKLVHFIHYNPMLTNKRYLCAIESALHQNPEHYVIVHVPIASEFVKSIESILEPLDVYQHRLRFRSLTYKQWFAQTPLQTWYESGLYKKSSWIEQNLGNAVRLAIIWKVGGVYIDLDIISTNTIEGIGRALCQEDYARVNNAFLSFPPRDQLVWELMEEFVKNFNGYVWGNNGPRVVTDVIKERCKASPHHIAPHVCQARLLERQRFFPIHYSQLEMLNRTWNSAQGCDTLGWIASQSIGVHWWASLESVYKQRIDMNQTTLIRKVFQAMCPITNHILDSKPESPVDVAGEDDPSIQTDTLELQESDSLEVGFHTDQHAEGAKQTSNRQSEDGRAPDTNIKKPKEQLDPQKHSAAHQASGSSRPDTKGHKNGAHERGQGESVIDPNDPRYEIAKGQLPVFRDDDPKGRGRPK